MKKIKIKYYLFALALVAISLQGCENTDLSVKDSPNALSPTTADVDLYLNSIQKDLSDFFTGQEGSNFDGMSEFGMEPVRMLHGFGPSYRELNDPADFDQAWETAYSKILTDVRAMTVLAEENELYTHIAIGQIIESYVMTTLVDFFGDVPYSEAVKGAEGNFNPAPDSGASIYAAVEVLLDAAITNLNRTAIAEPTNDLYYNGSKDNWIKFANTLKLKMKLQTRLVDAASSTSAINSLISGGDLILTAAEDFAFKYSINASAPDSRHPFFEKNYGGTGPNSDFYMTVYYMNLLANTYSLPDPRTRYYLYRQVSNFDDATVVTKDCSNNDAPSFYTANDIFCLVPATNGMNGFWGRNHMDPDGIPPDQQFRTLFGAYPAGGPFDDDSARNVSGSTAPSEGLQGAGIAPIMLASYVKFMLAESALTLGTTGDAATYLEEGIRESITKTMTFGAPTTVLNGVDATKIPAPANIDTYVNEVIAAYNAAVSESDKLDVITQQYFIALFGNGVEAFNTYRRNGLTGISPAVDLADPGVFSRSHWYPQTAADNNQNLTQKANVETPVFWDTRAAGFVK